MANNNIPQYYDPVVILMEDAADGAAAHGVSIGLKQNTEAAIRGDLNALVGIPAGPDNEPPAVPGAKMLWGTAKANKTSASAALRTQLSNGRAVAMACVGRLKPALGNSWTPAWEMAGFTGGSLAIPGNPLPLLQQLREYFVARPGDEIPNISPWSITAAVCEEHVQAISVAQSQSNQSNTDHGTAKKNFENALATARRRLTGLREELSQLMDDDDVRWYAFGFDRPSDPTTPEVPENLTLVAGTQGTVFADWDDARRATGYRVRVTNAQTGAELFSQLCQDSEISIPGLPGGVTVNVTIAARGTGESQPCEPVSIVVP